MSSIEVPLRAVLKLDGGGIPPLYSFVIEWRIDICGPASSAASCGLLVRLDTASDFTTIPRRIAQQAGILSGPRIARSTVYTAHGTYKADLYKAQLQLGNGSAAISTVVAG